MMPSATFWRGKRVLLTGHSGFKGSWASLWLRHLGATVFGLSLAPDAATIGGDPLFYALGGHDGDGSIGDIRDADRVAAAFAHAAPDIVLHMAAQALVRPSYDDPLGTFQTNVIGLINILDAARRSASVRAIVNITSDKCYENTEQLWAYRETEPMGGKDPYSASKGCAELVTAAYRRSFFASPDGPFLASARAGNVVGGGDWAIDRLVPDCIRAFAAGQPVLIRNPLATRPWQHVLEPISGYLILAQALFEQGQAIAEGWNFGPTDDDAWPVSRVVDAVTGKWGGGARWSLDQGPHPHEAMLLRVDAAKARARLGWRPRLPIADGLAWTVDWYKAVAEGTAPVAVMQRQIAAYQALGDVAS